MHGVGAADRLFSSLGEAQEAHFALPNQSRHGADHVLDRHLPVDAVLIQQVDAVRTEAAQGGFHHLAHVLRPAVQPHRLPAFDAEAELGGDDHSVAPALQGTSQELFVVEGAVDLGGVEEGHPELDSSLDGGNRFWIVADAIGLAHPHASQPECRDLEPLSSEAALRQHDVSCH